MTTAQIKYIFSKLNFQTDQWIPLSGVEFIKTQEDNTIIIDNNKYRYRFNTSKELLEIVYGYVREGVFYSRYNETSGFSPDGYESFESIRSFIRSSESGYMGTWNQKKFD